MPRRQRDLGDDPPGSPWPHRMPVLAGQGDPARSMALLWRTPSDRTGPGPKPGLSVDAIVAAAIAVADADGLAGLSMRAVAERLGVTAMALYTYVPGKNELVDLMYDGAHAELPGRYDLGDGWRAAVTSWATDLVRFYVRHPWAPQVSFARPVLGPNEQAVVEALARILRQTGLPPAVGRRVVSLLFYVARGTAQAVAESRLAATVGGASEQAWWSSRAAALLQVAPDFAERFPDSTWLASAGAAHRQDDAIPYLEREAMEAFTAGLTVLLDGIEAARDRRAQ
jgi:AcrR family transcriptional regulator